MTYIAEQVIGSSCGIIYKASVAETGKTVVIKKVMWDNTYKNREY